MAAAGLQVVAIGLGRPENARNFGRKLAPSLHLLTNEAPHLNLAYGLGRRRFPQLFKLDLVLASLRAVWRGHWQRPATGDVQMLPGTFLVDRQGIIQFAYYSAHPGDYPDLTALIARAEQGQLSDPT